MIWTDRIRQVKILLVSAAIVIAAAKRARQIIDGAEPLIARPKCNKPLSIAVEELYTGAVRIVSDDEDFNEGEEA